MTGIGEINLGLEGQTQKEGVLLFGTVLRLAFATKVGVWKWEDSDSEEGRN